MSKWGKLFLLISGCSLLIIAGARYILGAFFPILYIFLAIFILGLIVSLVLDYKFYLEILSIKTTKDGLGFGASLLLLIILLASIAFLSNEFNKNFDLTEEGLNSLSQQSIDILDSLQNNVEFKVFYNGNKISQNGRMIKNEIDTIIRTYRQESSKLKLKFIDSYKENLLANKYLSSLADKDRTEVFVFVEHEGQRSRVDTPYTEESITSAIIRVRKRNDKEIYFLIGHGEKDLRNEKADGLHLLHQNLKNSGFIIKEWSFFQDGKPSKPPALILSFGPRRPFPAEELLWLKDYLKEGGKIFFALDPGEKHNLKKFLSDYQIDYKNNFVINQPLSFSGRGALSSWGLIFDPKHSITKKFQSNKDVSIFDTASEVDFLSTKQDKFETFRLVRTHRKTFTTPVLKQKIEVSNLRSVNLAVEVRKKSEKDNKKDSHHNDSHHHDGSHHHDDSHHNDKKDLHKDEKNLKEMKEEKAGFRLLVFGDSDFLNNKSFYEGINKDLALNSLMSLLDEGDLVTIRPKQPKGTQVTLNRTNKLFIISLVLILPLLLILIGAFLWYRRKGS